MAPPIIHGTAISTYVRTTRLVCEEKAAEYQLVEVDIMQGGNKAPEHLARHPFGRVPAFEHDGFTPLRNQRHHPLPGCRAAGPALTPSDAKGRRGCSRRSRSSIPTLMGR